MNHACHFCRHHTVHHSRNTCLQTNTHTRQSGGSFKRRQIKVEERCVSCKPVGRCSCRHLYRGTPVPLLRPPACPSSPYPPPTPLLCPPPHLLPISPPPPDPRKDTGWAEYVEYKSEDKSAHTSVSLLYTYLALDRIEPVATDPGSLFT